MKGTLELFLIEELQYQEDEVPTKRRRHWKLPVVTFNTCKWTIITCRITNLTKNNNRKNINKRFVGSVSLKNYFHETVFP